MELPRDGQEYARITFTDLPDDAVVEASIDERVTWHATTSGDDASERRLLLRGPDLTGSLGLPLGVGYTTLWVRVLDTPETVVRTAGHISVF